ncbi:hypothetical protein PGB90_009480 [Kerria lacca]
MSYLLAKNGIKCVGPSKKAAQIEADKKKTGVKNVRNNLIFVLQKEDHLVNWKLLLSVTSNESS